MDIRQTKYQEAKAIKNISFIEAMQIAKDFEMAERKNNIINDYDHDYLYQNFCRVYVCTSIIHYPDRTENPKDNKEDKSCSNT